MSNDLNTFNGLSRDDVMDLSFHVIKNMSIEELDKIFDCRWHIISYLQELEYPTESIRDNINLMKYIDDLTKNKSPY